jgi:hypothetical protein
MVKIAIVGPGRSGKDETASLFKKHSILRYNHSTSYQALDIVYEKMITEHGYAGFYKDKEECFADRANHRNLWAHIITEYNKEDPTRLYKKHLEDSDILTGLRKRKEVQACVEQGLIDLVIYIENTAARFNSGDQTIDFDGHDSVVDIILSNNSTLSVLEKRIVNLCDAFTIRKYTGEDITC